MATLDPRPLEHGYTAPARAALALSLADPDTLGQILPPVLTPASAALTLRPRLQILELVLPTVAPERAMLSLAVAEPTLPDIATMAARATLALAGREPTITALGTIAPAPAAISVAPAQPYLPLLSTAAPQRASITLTTRTVATTAGLCDWVDLAECSAGAWIDLLECCDEPLRPARASLPLVPYRPDMVVPFTLAPTRADIALIGPDATLSIVADGIAEWGPFWLDTSATDYTMQVWDDAGALVPNAQPILATTETVCAYFGTRAVQDAFAAVGATSLTLNGTFVPIGAGDSFRQIANAINAGTGQHGVRAAFQPSTYKNTSVAPRVLASQSRIKLNSAEPITLAGDLAALGLDVTAWQEPRWDLGADNEFVVLYGATHDGTGHLATGEVSMWQKLRPTCGPANLWDTEDTSAEWQLVGAGNFYRNYIAGLDSLPWDWHRPIPTIRSSIVADPNAPIVGTTLAERHCGAGDNPGSATFNYWPPSTTLSEAHKIINHDSGTITIRGDSYVTPACFFEKDLVAVLEADQLHLVSPGGQPMYLFGEGNSALGFRDGEDSQYGRWLHWYFDSFTVPNAMYQVDRPVERPVDVRGGVWFMIADARPMALRRYYHGDQSWHDWPIRWKRATNFDETPTGEHYVNARYDLYRGTYSDYTARWKLEVFTSEAGTQDLEYYVGDEPPLLGPADIRRLSPVRANAGLIGRSPALTVIGPVIASVAPANAALATSGHTPSIEVANVVEPPLLVLKMDFDGDMLDALGHAFTSGGSTPPVLDTALFRSGTGSLLIANLTSPWNASYLYSVDVGADFMFTGDFTAEAWLYQTGRAGWSSWLSDGGGTLMQFGRRSDGLPFAYAGSSLPIIYANSAPALNTWYHHCIERKGNLVRQYINGVLQTQSATTAATIGDGRLEIGAGTNAGDNEPFRGNIDRVRVWKEAHYGHQNFTPGT